MYNAIILNLIHRINPGGNVLEEKDLIWKSGGIPYEIGNY